MPGHKDHINHVYLVSIIRTSLNVNGNNRLMSEKEVTPVTSSALPLPLNEFNIKNGRSTLKMDKKYSNIH